MMKIEDIVGDIILILLSDPAPFADLGINQKSIYTRVKGYDEYGIWIEHPGLKIPKIPKEADLKAGKVPAKPRYQTVVATVLISWGFILSIVHFPDVEGFDYPSPFEHHIGFDIGDEASGD
ncbi:MAG: hypothetical protein ABIA75_01305 [Candidatus Neomarinimicrobiota bacterium]